MILPSEDVYSNRLKIHATKPESQSNYVKAVDINNSIMVEEKKKYIWFMPLMKKKYQSQVLYSLSVTGYTDREELRNRKGINCFPIFIR